VKPFPVRAEAEKRPQRAEPLALSACAEIPAVVKNIDVAGGELVEHHVAARVSESRQLFRERLVLTQRRGRNPGPFPIAQENLNGIGNFRAFWPCVFSQFRRELNDVVAIPGVSGFPRSYEDLCFVPIGFGGLLAVEFPPN
jgi:hypothetical protein